MTDANRISRSMTRKVLRRRVTEKLRVPAALKRLDPAVDSRSSEGESTFDAGAVLVSDLTGFTSGTRKHGIVHVASVIVRMRQICLPVLHEQGAIFIGTEGDNLIVLLPNARAAVNAAVGMRDAISRHNASMPEARSHHHVKLGGIGLHCGGPIVLDRTEGALRGAVASLTYHIGEELCSDGKAVEFEEEPPVTVKEVVPLAPVPGDESAPPPLPLPAADDGRYLHPSLLPLAARHATKDDEALAALDESLSALLRPATILMFKITDPTEAAAGYSTADAGSARACQEACLHLLRPVLVRHGGTELEPCLWLFPRSAVDAVKAALAAAQAVRRATGSSARAASSGADAPSPPAPAFGVSGFGVHHGPLLYIEGTDVHWGDPVNTSSKLGQDLAQGGEVLISSAARDALLAAVPNWAARCLTMRPREVTISKVQLHAYQTEARSLAERARTAWSGLCGGAPRSPRPPTSVQL